MPWLPGPHAFGFNFIRRRFLASCRAMDGHFQSPPSLAARFGLAWTCFWRILGRPDFASRLARELAAPESRPAAVPTPAIPTPAVPAPVPPERLHASGLRVLAQFQREGRLIDFLQEDVASFSDAEVGAAARVVHAGCKKALAEHFTLAPAIPEAEGAAVTLPAGFDAARIRITGNVAGQPPFRGTVKHHGWVAGAVRLPALSETLDPRILAAAEVEL